MHRWIGAQDNFSRLWPFASVLLSFWNAISCIISLDNYTELKIQGSLRLEASFEPPYLSGTLLPTSALL